MSAKSRRTNAIYEHVVTSQDETFLWRKDNYPWERNVWNFHPEVEIHLIRNASGIALVGDHIGEFWPGHVTVIGSNLPHDWVTMMPPGEVIEARDIVIQFHPDKLKNAASDLPELALLDQFLKRAERGLVYHSATRARAASYIEELGELKGFERLVGFFKLIELLHQTDEYDYLSSPAFSPDLEYGSRDTLQQALDYILANISGDISLSEVATLCGMSESTFSRFFKKNSGNNFIEHVSRLRIWKAAQLLAETDLPITDICFEVGYLNISNFNRMFLRLQNMTPSNYRKNARSRMTQRPPLNGR